MDATLLTWTCLPTDYSWPRLEPQTPKDSSVRPKMAPNTANSSGSETTTGLSIGMDQKRVFKRLRLYESSSWKGLGMTTGLLVGMDKKRQRVM